VAKITVDELRTVADIILAHRAPGLGPEVFAELFDSLVWTLDDNGTAVVRLCEEWLASGDRERVEVALEMDELCPFTDPSMLVGALDRISRLWPDLSSKCQRLRADRAQLGV